MYVARLKKAQDFRDEMIKLFKPFVVEQFPQFRDSEGDLHMAASFELDTILFNIDSVMRVIQKSLESMRDHGDIRKENLLPFVWEVIRYYSAAPCIPYCSGIVLKLLVCSQVSSCS